MDEWIPATSQEARQLCGALLRCEHTIKEVIKDQAMRDELISEGALLMLSKCWHVKPGRYREVRERQLIQRQLARK